MSARAHSNTFSGIRVGIVVLLAIAAVLLASARPSSGASDRSPGDPRSGQGRDLARVWPAPAPSPESYQLDAGDHLNVRFYDRFDRDDLNGDYVIGESGQVRLPRIGIFSARSRTTAELERDIRAAVESKGEKLGYFSIEVIRCRPYYIVGLVDRPGPYPFLPGLTVVHAVSLAGGLYRPSASAAEVLREKRELTEITGRLAEALARRARLEAELDGSQTVTLPKELIHLEPSRVREIVATEHAALDRWRQAISGEKSGLERLIALKQRE
jgi:polysaccharide biosynthesis/export protein ExoF